MCLKSTDEAISLDICNLQAYMIKQEVFLKLGETDKAIAVLKEALSIHQPVELNALIALQDKYEELTKPPEQEPIKSKNM